MKAYEESIKEIAVVYNEGRDDEAYGMAEMLATFSDKEYEEVVRDVLTEAKKS